MSKSTATVRLDQQLDAKFVTITPATAEDWLGKNEANRNIRPAKVGQLFRDLEAGSFLVTGDTIKFDWNGNLIDGQHRLTAIRDAGVEAVCLVVTGLDPAVKTVIDTGAKRTPSDALRMANKNSTRSLPAAIKLIAGVQGGYVVRAGDRAPELTHSETIAFYDGNSELLDYCILFANRHAGTIGARPSALAAAMFIAGQKDLGIFTQLVTNVADLKFGGEGDPARTLYKRLQTLRLERHETSEELYFLLRAFESAVTKKRITLMKSATGAGRAIIPTWGFPSAA